MIRRNTSSLDGLRTVAVIKEYFQKKMRTGNLCVNNKRRRNRSQLLSSNRQYNSCNIFIWSILSSLLSSSSEARSNIGLPACLLACLQILSFGSTAQTGTLCHIENEMTRKIPILRSQICIHSFLIHSFFRSVLLYLLLLAKATQNPASNRLETVTFHRCAYK